MPKIVYCQVKDCSSNKEGICIAEYIHHYRSGVCAYYMDTKQK